MRIPLVRGRFIEDTDRAGAPAAAVMSASMARAWWAGRDPIGQHFGIGDTRFTIVGVVADMRHASLAAAPAPT